MTENPIYNSWCNSYQKWFIGNDLRTILLGNSAITQQVGQNIYPIVAAENTQGDFIVYSREKYSKETVKNGVYEDDCQVAIVAISDKYDNAIELASKIDNALTGKHTLNNGTIIKLELFDSTETFNDNKYIETLVFTIK